MLWHIKGP